MKPDIRNSHEPYTIELGFAFIDQSTGGSHDLGRLVVSLTNSLKFFLLKCRNHQPLLLIPYAFWKIAGGKKAMISVVSWVYAVF